MIVINMHRAPDRLPHKPNEICWSRVVPQPTAEELGTSIPLFEPDGGILDVIYTARLMLGWPIYYL